MRSVRLHLICMSRPGADLARLFQASSLRRRNIPSHSIRVSVSDTPETFLHHPFRLSRTALKIHSTLACTWIRYVFPSKTFVRDLAHRVAQAPLTISINSPLELVQQFFVKLGARYVIVTDEDGYCELLSCSCQLEAHLEPFADEGVIDKNGWLAFLGHLERKAA